MKNLKNLLYGKADTAQEFLIREKQVNRQSGINLDEDGVFRVADKGFDTQVLLDFPEENFDVPAVFVDVGDSFGASPSPNVSEYAKRKARKDFGRRSVIEPVIGHLKSDFRLARNYLKGTIGDAINLLMAATAFNCAKWMKAVAKVYFLHL